ncbi:glutamate-cysteine ligase family protein [Micromonospora sp. C95]|uniref:glutamate-cysteine ligase family protein n=1 Tax=Micromonospora sp. C95 TaxID=2824882 RepID=UPI001B36E713|nr:glutamate-cysteine ligase family protein [Micromonospora sp. C95]MBQ1022756.1 glutamylcysteine synthetase [Micromonospora sp. C95]
MHATAGPPLAEQDAEAYLARHAFHTGTPRLVGLRVEWLLRDSTDPGRAVPAPRVKSALAAHGAPPHGRHEVAPSGAITVISPPYRDLGECVRRTAEDLAAIRAGLAGGGLAALPRAVDPRRATTAAAAVRVRLDAGHAASGPLGFRRRWALAHAVGPVLLAAFANSPTTAGGGWRSSRQATLLRLDPRRTAPPPGGDPRESWSRYALDAPVASPAGPGTAPVGLTFRQWLRAGHPRRPTLDDLDRHLDTLLPPVRPRGHLELAMIDGQPVDGWPMPLAVAAALFADAQAGDEALAATERLHALREPYRRGPWTRAARHGLRDPHLAAAARECFHIAYAALARTGAPPAVRGAVADFIERYVARRRCPADDTIAALIGDGTTART